MRGEKEPCLSAMPDCSPYRQSGNGTSVHYSLLHGLLAALPLEMVVKAEGRSWPGAAAISAAGRDHEFVALLHLQAASCLFPTLVKAR